MNVRTSDRFAGWAVLSLIAAVALLALPACARKEQGGTAVVKGKALTPLSEAYLYAYKEGMDLRGPAFATSAASGPEGDFSLTLPPGKYLLVVRRRVEGATVGPVATGDYRSDVLGPITVRGGEQITKDFIALLKVGETKGLPALNKIPAKTGITGKVLDSDGKPVQGARIQAYEHSQMSERPKFVSEGSGVDGSYSLFFPEGGTYYIAARNKFGGPPKIGELYGRYDDGTVEPSAVFVKDGEVLQNVNITMHKLW
jgi:hypothetical protein